jgi:hypothetical protein
MAAESQSSTIVVAAEQKPETEGGDKIPYVLNRVELF